MSHQRTTYRSKSLLAVVTTTVLFTATRLSTEPRLKRSATALKVLSLTAGARALPASLASVRSATGDVVPSPTPPHNLDAASSSTTATKAVLELGMTGQCGGNLACVLIGQ